MNSAEQTYHDRYNKALSKIGKHERQIHILKLKTRIHKDLLAVSANREAREEALGRLRSSCCHGHVAIQQELSALQEDLKKRGRNARHLMLAYGFLRGKTYDQIESCTPGNEPDFEAILGFIPEGFAGDTDLGQQLREWPPERDATTEYILTIPKGVPSFQSTQFTEEWNRARLSQERALKAWGKLRELNIPRPQAAWAPDGSFMFFWKDDGFHLELEFTDNIELYFSSNRENSDNDLSLSKAIEQIQTQFEKKEAA